MRSASTAERSDRHLEHRLDALREGRALARLVGERLDGAHLVDRLVDVAGDVGHPVLHGARELAQPRADEHDRQQHQRHSEERQHRELGAGEEEHHDATHERDRHPQA
jgi:hypothetical protein